jgi:hypothetical protein
MGEPETKGSGFLAIVNTLRVMLPEEAFERVVRALPADTAELVRKPPLPVAWVHSRHFFDVVGAAARVAFGGDEERLLEVGRRAMQGDLKTVYKMFIKLFSPGFVIERGTRLWQTYSRNSGHLRAAAVGDKACDVFYEDLPQKYMTTAYWAYQRGCLKGVIEATGMKNVQVDVLEGGGRENRAVVRIRWS